MCFVCFLVEFEYLVCIHIVKKQPSDNDPKQDYGISWLSYDMKGKCVAAESPQSNPEDTVDSLTFESGIQKVKVYDHTF